jgi:hypothetical protein
MTRLPKTSDSDLDLKLSAVVQGLAARTERYLIECSSSCREFQERSYIGKKRVPEKTASTRGKTSRAKPNKRRTS